VIAAPLPPDEEERLLALRRTNLLDSPPESAFDDFTRLAALLCDAPIAAVSLIDRDRQWFKSRVGVDLAEAPRALAFCGHAILAREVMEVRDARLDPRFADHPLVLGPLQIRFYAGAPLLTPDGHALGTLCVLDNKPRALEPQQREALEALARQVVTHVELRVQKGELDRALRELQRTQVAGRTASRAVQSLLNLQAAIFESASHAIIASAPDGTVLSFNRAAARMLGYDAGEVVGKETLARFHDAGEVAARAHALTAELREPIEPGFEALVARARRGLPDEREWTFVRKDGSRFPVTLSMTGLRGEAGQLTGFVGLAQDITERKQVDQLKNEFVSIVSHELRTPLTSIRGALGLLEGEAVGALPPGAFEMVAIARSNADRLIRLINDILDLEKIEAGKIELKLTRLDAGQLIRTALEGIRGVAEGASIELRGEAAAEAIFTGDHDRLLQVLTNLVSNAIKFSPPRGAVAVRAETAGANVRFAVADAGPGIPEHQRSLLFRKFQQLDASDARRRGGSGLGLAISKAIVEQHRGRMWVESEAGLGAVFLFEVPRLPLHETVGQPAPRRAS
jgi:PAS domain S-box-containing protein